MRYNKPKSHTSPTILSGFLRAKSPRWDLMTLKVTQTIKMASNIKIGSKIQICRYETGGMRRQLRKGGGGGGCRPHPIGQPRAANKSASNYSIDKPEKVNYFSSERI